MTRFQKKLGWQHSVFHSTLQAHSRFCNHFLGLDVGRRRGLPRYSNRKSLSGGGFTAPTGASLTSRKTHPIVCQFSHSLRNSCSFGKLHTSISSWRSGVETLSLAISSNFDRRLHYFHYLNRRGKRSRRAHSCNRYLCSFLRCVPLHRWTHPSFAVLLLCIMLWKGSRRSWLEPSWWWRWIKNIVFWIQNETSLNLCFSRQTGQIFKQNKFGKACSLKYEYRTNWSQERYCRSWLLLTSFMKASSRWRRTIGK